MTLNEFLDEWNNPSATLLVHTSGSTGEPKPMWVEKAKMLNSARITCDFLGLKAGDSALLCMPLDYIAGKMVVVRSIERHLRLINVKPCGHPLADGIYPSDEPMPVFAAMVPLQVYNSLQVPEERERLRAIRHLIIGGGPVDDEMRKALADFPNHIWSSYAMTETLSHIALRQVNGKDADEWYTPFDTVSVEQAEDGCLVIDAPLVHDGKLKTNDLVEMRRTVSDGKIITQFRVLGRKDNVIDSGGIKIRVEDVERVLAPHLAGRFAITKVKDRKFGETVAIVTESTDIDAVKAVCEDVLPKYWRPRRYVHATEIPMTATGKIRRKAVEDLAAECQ